jgi:hypothetical protein
LLDADLRAREEMPAAAIDRASRGSFTSVLSSLIPGMPKSERPTRPIGYLSTALA